MGLKLAFLLILTAFSFPLSGPADDADLRAVEAWKALSNIRKEHEELRKASDCCDPTLAQKDSALNFQVSEGSEPLRKFRESGGCKDPLTTAKVCQLNDSTCGSLGRGYLSCNNPRLLDYQKSAHRAFRERIMREAILRFYQLTSDSRIQNTCCRDDQNCKTVFSHTKLFVIRGSTALKLRKAEFNRSVTPSQSRVVVSEDIILSCDTVSCYEQLFLHELGHACQLARPGAFRPIRFGTNDLCGEPTLSLDDFGDIFGKPVSECVLLKLKEYEKTYKAENKNGSVCLGSWGMEAFANAVFSAYRRPSTGWGWECHTIPDELHALGTAVTDCYMNSPDMRKRFCDDPL